MHHDHHDEHKHHVHEHKHGSSYGKGGHYPNCLTLTTHDDNDCRCEMKLYQKAVLATLVSGAVLGLLGYLANSLALAGEVLHTLIDSLDSFVSLAVMVVVLREPKRNAAVRSFGAKVAFILLVITILGMFYWGRHRLISPHEDVNALVMLSGGVVGFILNITILKHTGHIHEDDRSVNHEQLHYHAVADVFIELGVIVSAILIWLFGWQKIDAYAMLVIGAYLSLFILPRAYRRIGSS